MQQGALMEYGITVHAGYLRARLSRRESAAEMQQFMHRIARESKARRCACVLIDIHASRPIFHVDPRAFFEELTRLASHAALRVALLGDTAELRLSNEYLALLARQLGLNLQSFRDEATALRFLTDRRGAADRRHALERRLRRMAADASQRRRHERRVHAMNAQPAF
jgi:hypothetical protein